MSRLQKRIWTLARETGELPYRAQALVDIQGRLDQSVLLRALQHVVERYEILRTIFRCRKGVFTPSQVIDQRAAFSWQTVDLTNLDSPREDAVHRLFEQERMRPFGSRNGPSLRSILIVLGPKHNCLILALPAMCGDRRTLTNLIQDLDRCYKADLTGEVLTDEPVQYVQFSTWQHEVFEDDAAPAGSSYWQKHAGPLSGTALPFETRIANPLQFEPKVFPIELSPELTAAIQNRAAEFSSSVSTLLLASWYLFLWRLTDQTSLSVDVLVEGREYPELQHSLGLFARRLPISLQFDRSCRFVEVLSDLEQALRDALEWQDYFEPTGADDLDRSRESLGFEFFECPTAVAGRPPLFSIRRQYVCVDRYRLQLSARLEAGSLRLEIHYNGPSFETEDIRRTGEQFLVLMEAAILQPSRAVGSLPLVTATERALLKKWNETRTAYPLHETVHGLFEAQVLKTPDSIAVVALGQSKTYAELNESANSFAAKLRRLDIGQERIVGVYAARSIDFVIGILAVLKSGAAYLPLEPPVPPERLSFIRQDSGASVFLTTKDLRDDLPEEAEVILLDDSDQVFSDVGEQNGSPEVRGENLCYLIYTSGSTGEPKAVAVEHRQLTNYIHAILDRLDLPAGSHFALASTFAADLGHSVTFPSLSSGGCLHLLSAEQTIDADQFAGYFEDQQIDCLKIVPSHLKALLGGSRAKSVLPGQRLVLGGEAANWTLAEDVLKLAPELRVINHYGPTETTVGVLMGEAKKKDATPDSTTVPLGRPLANTQVYILDESLQMVPIGSSGELYIGGAGVARGYLNRPHLTAARFIPDPFTNQNGGRLYRSGDLARHLPCGAIEFLGRRDRQLKIRGFRLEPGEIEALLSNHPNVRDAAVVLREDNTSARELTAYFVPIGGALSDQEELREFLKSKIPPYMIPTTFVAVTHLPLTANGKLDYQALTVAEQKRQRSRETYVAPRSEIEAGLARIMSELFSLERVGVHDNFFQMGGHSLLATQFMSIVRDTFQVEIPLRRLFEGPTVGELAVAVVQSQAEQGDGEESDNLLSLLEQLPEDEVLTRLSEIAEGPAPQPQTLSD